MSYSCPCQFVKLSLKFNRWLSLNKSNLKKVLFSFCFEYHIWSNNRLPRLSAALESHKFVSYKFVRINVIPNISKRSHYINEMIFSKSYQLVVKFRFDIIGGSRGSLWKYRALSKSITESNGIAKFKFTFSNSNKNCIKRPYWKKKYRPFK